MVTALRVVVGLIVASCVPGSVVPCHRGLIRCSSLAHRGHQASTRTARKQVLLPALCGLSGSRTDRTFWRSPGGGMSSTSWADIPIRSRTSLDTSPLMVRFLMKVRIPASFINTPAIVSTSPAVKIEARYSMGMRSEEMVWNTSSASVLSRPSSVVTSRTGDSGGTYHTIRRVRYSGCSGNAIL